MLIDFEMPGMSGAEVARRVETTRPALRIFFVTGYANRAALEGVSEAKSSANRSSRQSCTKRGARPWRGGRRARSCVSDASDAAFAPPEQTGFFHVTSSLRLK
jgi:CheY-like chemotaxis protein